MRLPTVELELPQDAVVRFIGDVHLGDGAGNDPFGDRDHLLSRFLTQCGEVCDAVVFMGDAFDLPQAFSHRRVLRAHPVAVRGIAELCQRIPVHFVRGNHDWTVGYDRVFDGAQVWESLAVAGLQAMHGHQLDLYCNPERRFHRPKVTVHHLAERLFGFQFRVPLREHNTWQNRVAHWLGGQHGHHLRRMIRLYGRLGWYRRAADCEAFIHYWSRALWGDSHALFEPVAEALRGVEHRGLVCGHTHLPGVVRMAERTYVSAGSWAFGAAQYAQWDGAAIEVRDAASGQRYEDAAYRWMIQGPDPGDFFDWWSQHHRGGLRFSFD